MMRSDAATRLARGAVTLATLAVMINGCRGEHAKPARSSTGHDTASQRSGSAAAPGQESGSTATAAGLASERSAGGAAPADSTTCPGLAPLPSRFPAAERIVAIGDVHGDLQATRAALRLAGAVDARDRWIGGTLVLVQTGDILDRGDDEQAILDLFERLRIEAAAAGGAVHVLNGNHEIMNAAGDFRYVTPGGFEDFADVPGIAAGATPEATADVLDPEMRARAAAFMPGGIYARTLAGHNLLVMVGDSVFVHGGVLPAYAERGLESLNHDTRCWLLGNGAAPAMLADSNSPIWSRDYSQVPEACDDLEKALTLLGARRMVVGHTPQLRGITSACGDRVWRIDVGLAAYYGGPTQVLEIRGDVVRALGKSP